MMWPGLIKIVKWSEGETYCNQNLVFSSAPHHAFYESWSICICQCALKVHQVFFMYLKSRQINLYAIWDHIFDTTADIMWKRSFDSPWNEFITIYLSTKKTVNYCGCLQSICHRSTKYLREKNNETSPAVQIIFSSHTMPFSLFLR
jgi:hypothetical protein